MKNSAAERGVPSWVPRDLYPFESKFIDLDGHSIHYIDEGTGPTLLFVHGNPTWSFLYRDIVRRLKARFRCVALDYPGFGLSRAADGYDFLPASHAQVLDGFVAALGLTDFTIMVQDWGGPTGLWVAGKRADQVRGLVIGNTWAWPIDGDKHFERFSAMMGGVIGERLFKLTIRRQIPERRRRPTMAYPTERMEKLFFEVFEPLPRQGPGSRSSAKRALDLCTGLPPSPAVLDLGSGAGAQTFHLAELTTGTITAIDNHTPNIERLRAEVAERGLDERIRPLVGDIGKPEHERESFDLIWSEGALYNIGIEEALRLYHPVLKPGGFFAFTEAVWRKENPPPEAKAAFEDYAGMGSARDVLAKIDKSDFLLVGHFTLPHQDWWDDFYTPMERRIGELRGKYAGDADALAALDEIAREPEMHRRHSDYYGYEFFVVRRG